MKHAILRAAERYGVNLTEEDYRVLVAHILNQKSCCTKKMINTEIHAVLFQGKALIAVWSPRDKVIVTFLPKDAVTSKYRLVRFRNQEAEMSDTERKHMDGTALRKAANRGAAKLNRRAKSRRSDRVDMYDE